MKGAVVRVLAAVLAAVFAFSALSVFAFADAGAGQERLLKIGYVADRIPVSFQDKNGDFAGISRYIFDRVAELSGYKFVYEALPAGDVTYDRLIEGGFDLVSSVEYNRENQQARGILMSDPYLTSRKVVVARDGLDFRFDADLSIAVSTGSQTLRKVLGASYPNFSIVDYPSIQASFDAVSSGDADLLMLNQYVVEYWLSKPIYEKLNVIPVLGLDDQLCFSAVVSINGSGGLSEEDGREIIDRIDAAIAQLSEDEIGSFTIKGIMDNRYRDTFGDFIYRYRHAVQALAISLGVIIILSVLLWRLRLRYAENKADEKIRSRFLSAMSHEIKTPLNGIIGLNHLMSQKLDDRDAMLRYIKQSDVTANYLLSLVNDMLDMSGLQTGSVELANKPIGLNLLLDTVNSIAENAMQSKSIKYEPEIDLTAPYIMGDDVRIQQVLFHLLDNARKFTRRGGRVGLRITQTEENGKIITQAVVSDTGKGMSEEFQRRIFDTFARETEITDGSQGAGLGLSISRRLAIMMGGDLTVKSRKDEGSEFTFTFVSDPADMPAEALEQGSESAKGKKILVAEDNELNAEIITEFLSERGYSSVRAQDGEQALELFKSSENGEFGVILMDLLMPKLDGFEAAAAIRKLDRDDARTVRIIACTANSTPDDRAKADACGMNGFLAKPVDIERLVEAVEGR